MRLPSDLVPDSGVFVDGDEYSITLTHYADVSDVVESNKAEALARGRDITRDKDRWRKLASIPLVVWQELMREKVISEDGTSIVDEKRFRRWLNDPDNRFFRTSEGKA